MFLSKADANTEGTYVIIAKLNSNIKKNLEGDWKKKVQVTIKNGTCKVKNPTGVWEGNKLWYQKEIHIILIRMERK